MQLQKMVGMYFTFSKVIDKPGKYIKIVAYPKWKFTCLVFFDVEVEFCCIPGNVADVAWDVYIAFT